MEDKIYRVVIEYYGDLLSDIRAFADEILKMSNNDYEMCPNYLIIEERTVDWKEIYSA